MAEGEIKIYGQFRSGTAEGILADAKEIKDFRVGKDQETINQELYEGAGGGKVKDILVNEESILDEETGIAELNIADNEDPDISITTSGKTVYVEVKGISNDAIVLN